MKKDTEKAIDDKMTFKSEKESEIAEKLGDIADANSAKLTKKEDLDAKVEALKTMEPDCDFVFTTIDTRIRSRRIEIEGIDKALEQEDGIKLQRQEENLRTSQAHSRILVVELLEQNAQHALRAALSDDGTDALEARLSDDLNRHEG
jgi:hypothetical protein